MTENKKFECAIILPLYNEEDSLTDTVERLKKVSASVANSQFEIICVNDGSTDKTPDLLKNIPGITVITHKVNRGYGAALRTGLDYCSHEWIFIVDADGTYPIEDLGRLVGEVNDEIDMVVGARRGPGISTNPLKRLARWILRKMVHGLTDVMVPDLNSGMRIFRKDLYSQFRHLLPMGFSFTSTITVASLYSGYEVKYIPIQYEKRVGQSSIRPVNDFFNFTVLIIRLCSYFDPLRFFIPMSLIVYIVGFLRAVRDVLIYNYIGSLAIILLSLAVQIFIAGIITDVVVKRFLNDTKADSILARKRVIVNKN